MGRTRGMTLLMREPCGENSGSPCELSPWVTYSASLLALYSSSCGCNRNRAYRDDDILRGIVTAFVVRGTILWVLKHNYDTTG